MFELLGYSMIVMFAVGSLSTVVGVGKYREPLTGGVAVIVLVLNLISMWIIYGLIQGW